MTKGIDPMSRLSADLARARIVGQALVVEVQPLRVIERGFPSPQRIEFDLDAEFQEFSVETSKKGVTVPVMIMTRALGLRRGSAGAQPSSRDTKSFSRQWEHSGRLHEWRA